MVGTAFLIGKSLPSHAFSLRFALYLRQRFLELFPFVRTYLNAATMPLAICRPSALRCLNMLFAFGWVVGSRWNKEI